MSKKQNTPKYIKISKYISAFLMLAILFYQFQPFWSWTSVEEVEKKTITVDKRADVTQNEEGQLIITIDNGDQIIITAPEAEEEAPVADEPATDDVTTEDTTTEDVTTEDTTTEDTTAEDTTTEDTPAVEEEKEQPKGKLKLEFAPETKNVDYEMSIGQYIWFPYDYPTADEYFKSEINEDYSINDAVLFPVAILVLCVVSIVFCLKAKKITFLVWPAVTAIVTTVAYLVRPELKLGANWVSHLYPCIGVVLVVAWTIMKKIKLDKASKEVY